MAACLARAGYQLPVDDRVRLAAAFEARAADRRVDGVRGRLLCSQSELVTINLLNEFRARVFTPRALHGRCLRAAHLTLYRADAGQ